MFDKGTQWRSGEVVMVLHGSTLTPRRHLSCRKSNESCLLAPPKLYLSCLKTTNDTYLDLYNIQDDVSNKYVLVHFLSIEGNILIILRNKIAFTNFYCVKNSA